MATEYSPIFAVGRLPAVEATLTTRPHPRSAIAGQAARISRIGAITLSSKAAIQSSSGISSRSRHLTAPALLTTTSSSPNRSVASARMRSPASGSVMSRARWAARPCRAAPARPHSAAASFDLGLGARDEEHLGALLAEHAGDDPPDPAPGPGDDAGAAREPEVHQAPATSVRTETSAPPARVRWTGHLRAILSMRSTWSSLSPSGSETVTSNFPFSPGFGVPV